MEEIKLSPKVAAVLKVFLEDPTQARFGAELMRRTKQPSGTLYPILAKLEQAGWLTTEKEEIDPHKAGRPARRMHRMTGAAVAIARTELAAISELYRPPDPVRLGLALRDGAV